VEAPSGGALNKTTNKMMMAMLIAMAVATTMKMMTEVTKTVESESDRR
jgi:hypothetical protein